MYRSMVIYVIVFAGFGRLYGQRQSDLSGGSPPVINTMNIIEQLIAGYEGGYATGIIGAIAGRIVDHPVNGLDEYNSARRGYRYGTPIGSAVGVYYVGNQGVESGSLLATILGSFGGEFAFKSIISSTSDPHPLDIFGPPIGASIGATLGFNLTRRQITGERPKTGLSYMPNISFSGETSRIGVTFFWR